MGKNKFKLFHDDEEDEQIDTLTYQLNKLESELRCLKEKKECEISELKKQIDCLNGEMRDRTNIIECGTAISVAQELIDMDICGKNILGHDSSIPYYSKSELKQIAEHLLVYVNNTDDERD